MCLEPPKLTKSVTLETLKEGSFFSAVCTAQSGSVPLFFNWYKDGQAISSQSNEITINSVSEMQSILNVKKVKAKDSGNYTCSVRNAFGEDSHSIRLIVRGLNVIQLICC